MKPKYTWSYSSLDLFKQCPQKYYRLRVVKDVKDPPTEHLTYGLAVHKAAEEYVRDGTPIGQRQLSALSAIVAVHASPIGTVPFTTGLIGTALGRDLVFCGLFNFGSAAGRTGLTFCIFCLTGARAGSPRGDSFNLWVLPITAFLVAPSLSPILCAVRPSAQYFTRSFSLSGVQNDVICYISPSYVREISRGIGGTRLPVQIETLGLRCRSACVVLPLRRVPYTLGTPCFSPEPSETSPATLVSLGIRCNL